MALGKSKQRETAGTHQQGQGQVPAPFQMAIRTASEQVHACQCTEVGQGGDHPDGFQVVQAEVANQRGHPVGHSVRAAVDAEIHQPCDV
ncbi:hypothetical protein D3C80_1510030 [compost metagenome]